jgi:threonylcarbamoyladenosine tRNA methylthiotransferase MtaB
MNNKRRTFAITTLGCKVNQYESQQIRQLLENSGLTAAALHDKPDIVVVNTCCVTHIASAKSRLYISKARKLSPNAAIVVRGCLPTAQTGELNKIEDNIHLIGHNTDLGAELLRIITGQKIDTVSKTAIDPKIKHKNNLPKELSILDNFTGQTRAFLKIQDGCDGYCAYCIVPKLRTALYSKPPDLVLQEAKNLVGAGHREIVLSGIFLGAYGRDTVRRIHWPPVSPSPLAELLEKLSGIEGLARIRLSSLEPADLTDDLLDVFCRHTEKIVPHLHLPLQSGSEKIIRRMCRQYTVIDFRATVELLKRRLDRPAITTDIIVGFPGETDDDFQQTVELAKQLGFAKMHIFPFSSRKGTAAAKMLDKLPSEVIKERARTLNNLDKELAEKFRRQFIGETVTVIVENSSGKTQQGRCERYFMVTLVPQKLKVPAGTLISLKLTEDTLPQKEQKSAD